MIRIQFLCIILSGTERQSEYINANKLLEESLKSTFIDTKHDPRYAVFKQKDILQSLWGTESGLLPRLATTKEKEIQRYLVGLYHAEDKNFIAVPEEQIHKRSTKLAIATQDLLLNEIMFNMVLGGSEYRSPEFTIPTRHEQQYRIHVIPEEKILLKADTFFCTF